jgi:hypothetical protein
MNPRHLFTVLSLIGANWACAADAADVRPYPPSKAITGIAFDFPTRDLRAPGSDN